jgi:glycosyltransferase involved in cell wall biosynthesis
MREEQALVSAGIGLLSGRPRYHRHATVKTPLLPEILSVNPRPVLLLVSVATLFGGAETYYVKLAGMLRERYSLRAVVCDDRLASELEAFGVDVANVSRESSGYRRYTATAKAIWRMQRAGESRVAHLNGQPEAYLTPFLRMMGYRVVLTRHTPFTDRFLQEGSRFPVFLKRWMLSLCLSLSYRVVCVSQLLRTQLSAVISPDKLVVIPTWVPNRFLRMRTAPRPSPPLRLLFVGRVVTNKGIFDLIEAIRSLHDVRLDVVGEGDQLEDAKCAASGLNVVFNGFHKDCAPFYEACDLLVFPAHEGFEGLPQVPLEAMAMGVPCLGSNISSMREIVAQNSSAAMLYDQDNPADLARKIALLQESPSLQTELGIAGASHVAENFTEQIVRKQYFDFFDDAFQGVPVRPENEIVKSGDV